MKTMMLTSRRQILAGGAAAAALAALAACGTNNSGSGGTGSSGETVTITYWHRLPDKEGMTKVEEIVKTWNKENPTIQVKAVKFEGSAPESYAKIKQAVSAGDAPDLAQIGYAEIASEYLAGDLEDVTAELAEGGYESHYAPGPMSLCKLDGTAVGLPQDTGPLVYVYDKDAFDALGITAPTTWAEFKESAKTAKAAGKYIGTWQGDETGSLMSAHAAAAGATWYTIDGDAWKVAVDSPQSQKVATVYQELLDEELIFVPADGRWGDSWKKALQDGTLIGTVAAGWEPGFMLGDLGKDQTNWQITHLPRHDSADKQATGPDGGSALCVIKGSKHKAEALKFADWFNTQIEPLITQGLVVAATTAKPTTPDTLKKLWGGQDVYGFLAEANATMVPDLVYAPTWPTVFAEMGEVGGKVALGSAKVADVFTKAQKTSVSSLKDAGISVSE